MLGAAQLYFHPLTVERRFGPRGIWCKKARVFLTQLPQQTDPAVHKANRAARDSSERLGVFSYPRHAFLSRRPRPTGQFLGRRLVCLSGGDYRPFLTIGVVFQYSRDLLHRPERKQQCPGSSKSPSPRPPACSKLRVKSNFKCGHSDLPCLYSNPL